MTPHRNLIFDIGLNKGEDSAFYLAKGFRVIAIEANPTLTRACTEKFSSEIANGSLVILNCGIWDEEKTLTFYENLDNDHWSSFDKGAGTRLGSRYKTYEVECIRIVNLFERFGCPYYLKIDVEHADKHILKDMRSLKCRPRFISCEEDGVETFDLLSALGYDHFQIVSQNTKHLNQRPPEEAREGRFVEWSFGPLDSGLFGFELSNEWLSFDETRSKYLAEIRDASGRFLQQNDWFDIHATTQEMIESAATGRLIV